MKKLLLAILASVMCLSMCACGGNDNSYEKDTTISSSFEAINTVKNDINTNSRISRGLGYKFYKEPSYGTCTASKNSDGSWDVTLMGNMWGYYNDTKTDLDHCGFILKATVSENGSIISAYAEKAD